MNAPAARRRPGRGLETSRCVVNFPRIDHHADLLQVRKEFHHPPKSALGVIQVADLEHHVIRVCNAPVTHDDFAFRSPWPTSNARSDSPPAAQCHSKNSGTVSRFAAHQRNASHGRSASRLTDEDLQAGYAFSLMTPLGRENARANLTTGQWSILKSGLVLRATTEILFA